MKHDSNDGTHASNEHRPGDTPREDAMNEQDENNLPHDERHERLCAYVFGELEGEERSAFEAELEGDPKLKAELERLEATVGLVSAHGGGALALSEGAAAQLAERVQASKPAPVIQLAWYQKPWLKVAAALALVGGVGYTLDANGVFGEPGLVQNRAFSFKLGDLGHTADAPAAQAPEPTGVPLSEEQLQREAATRKAFIEERERELAAHSFEGLGYLGGSVKTEGQGGELPTALREQLKSLAYMDEVEPMPESAPPTVVDPKFAAELESLGYAAGQPSGETITAVNENARGRHEAPAEVSMQGLGYLGQQPNEGGATPFKSGENWLQRRAGGGGGASFADPALEQVVELNSQLGLGGGAGGAGGGAAPTAGRRGVSGGEQLAGAAVRSVGSPVGSPVAPNSPPPSRAAANGAPTTPGAGGPATPGTVAGVQPSSGGGAYKGAGDTVPPDASGGAVDLRFRTTLSAELGSMDYFLGDGSQGDIPIAGLNLDLAGKQQVQDLQVFYAATKQPTAQLDALRLLVELDDKLVEHPGVYRYAELERGATFGLDFEAGDTDPILLGGLWAAQDPSFLQLEQERMQAAGLDQTGWVQMLKQFEYLPQDFEGAFDDPATQIARFHLLEPVLREQRLNELLLDIQRRPGETLDLFYYRHWGTRPFQSTADDPQSTFSADVDTASYALARKMLTQGVFPTRDQIRVEEFVNYFDAGLPAPGSGDQGISGDANFALSAELAPAPFGPSDEPTWLLRVGAKAREVDQSQRSPLNLTFVVDTSGSMDKENRKDLVKGALRLLVNQLDSRDTISIVRFAKDATTLIEPTPANQRGRILAAIELLGADGGTNVEAGLLHGYTVAATAFDQAKVNRVVFLSDGVGNIGETDQERILAQATDQRGLGIYLNTIGVGLENHNDVFLEQLADNGDGLCNYVGDALEARRALVENFTGAFEPVARDVKLQVTFDPARVGKYRLLGYENRAIADRDFTNAKVDAAELNAGHEVVALYELQGVQFDGEAPLGTFKLRYKAPFGDEQHMDELERDAETELGLSLSGSLSQFDWRSASLGYQRGALAAQVAEVLRRSGHAKGDDFDGLVADIKRVADASTDADFREFAGLIERNQAAIAALAPEPSEAQDLLDQLKYAQYELELERNAEGEPDAAKIAAKEAAVEALEQKLRDLVLVGLAQTEETLESPGGPPSTQDVLEEIGYVDDSEEG
ncbi:MAG: YfbK domain-containing protein [Planctomycetota bacterium]|jgi:Ca-activated chloride channel family protein